MQDLRVTSESIQADTQPPSFELIPSHRVAQLIAGFVSNENALVTLRTDGKELSYELGAADRLLRFTEPAGESSCMPPIEIQANAARIKNFHRLYTESIAVTYENETLIFTQGSSCHQTTALPAIADETTDAAMAGAEKFKVSADALKAALSFCSPFVRASAHAGAPGLRFKDNTMMTGDGILAVAIVELKGTDLHFDFGISPASAARLRTVLAYTPSVVEVAVTKEFVEVGDKSCRLRVLNVDAKLPKRASARQLLEYAPSAVLYFKTEDFVKEQLIHHLVLRPPRRGVPEDRGVLTLAYDPAIPEQVSIKTMNSSDPGYSSTSTWKVGVHGAMAAWQMRVDLDSLARIVWLDGAATVAFAPLKAGKRALWVSQETESMKGVALLAETSGQ